MVKLQTYKKNVWLPKLQGECLFENQVSLEEHQRSKAQVEESVNSVILEIY